MRPPANSASTRSSRRTTPRSSRRAVALGAAVIGVNARDLSTFAIDRRAQLELVASAPRDRVVVAESAIARARPGRRGRARGRGRSARRVDADAGGRSGREAAGAARAPAREGLRADARGGRRRRRRGGRRPGRLHPRRETPRRAPGVLPVPETMLSVAVLVGEVADDGADLVQLYARENGHRGRDGVLLRDGEQVARVVDRPGRRRIPTISTGRARPRAGSCSRRARARERPRGDRARPAVGGGRELEPRDRAGHEGSRRASALRGGGRMLTYGDYGGRFVPETLIPALDELEAGWQAAPPTPSFQAELDELGRELRRPADAADARRALRAGQAALPEARGPAPHRRAQAEQRARPGAARPAARQAPDRGRDRRRPARRRDRDRLRPLRPRVRRLHGRRGHAPPAPNVERMAPARRRGARRSSSARGR